MRPLISSWTPGTADADVCGLLEAWSQGDEVAWDQLLTVVYHELRRCAAAHLRRERIGDTLQPTALVHEAYLRLVKQDGFRSPLLESAPAY